MSMFITWFVEPPRIRKRATSQTNTRDVYVAASWLTGPQKKRKRSNNQLVDRSNQEKNDQSINPSKYHSIDSVAPVEIHQSKLAEQTPYLSSYQHEAQTEAIADFQIPEQRLVTELVGHPPKISSALPDDIQSENISSIQLSDQQSSNVIPCPSINSTVNQPKDVPNHQLVDESIFAPEPLQSSKQSSFQAESILSQSQSSVSDNDKQTNNHAKYQVANQSTNQQDNQPHDQPVDKPKRRSVKDLVQSIEAVEAVRQVVTPHTRSSSHSFKQPNSQDVGSLYPVATLISPSVITRSFSRPANQFINEQTNQSIEPRQLSSEPTLQSAIERATSYVNEQTIKKSKSQSNNHPHNQSINQSAQLQSTNLVHAQSNMPTSQSINQSNTSDHPNNEKVQSVNQSNQTVNRSITQTPSALMRPPLLNPMRTFNQSTNQNQSNDQLSNTPTNRLTYPRISASTFNLSMNPSNNQTNNQSINQNFNRAVNRSFSLVYPPMMPSLTSPMKQSRKSSFNQLADLPTNHTRGSGLVQSNNPSNNQSMSAPVSPKRSANSVLSQLRRATVDRSSNQTINQLINQSESQVSKQLNTQPGDQPINQANSQTSSQSESSNQPTASKRKKGVLLV